MHEWTDLLLRSDYGGMPGGPEAVLFMLLLAFVIGHVVGWIYMWTHEAISYSRTFVASLAILPVLVAMMMVLMAGSLVVAFGLLAVFAVVRFRNVLKDTRDTTFILWSIMEGLAVGTLKFSTAVLGAAVVSVVLVYLRVTAFGTRQRYDALVQLQLAADSPAMKTELKEILRMYCAKAVLAGQHQTASEGVSVIYRVLLRDPVRGGDLQRDLERTQGIRGASVLMREDESEI